MQTFASITFTKTLNIACYFLKVEASSVRTTLQRSSPRWHHICRNTQ